MESAGLVAKLEPAALVIPSAILVQTDADDTGRFIGREKPLLLLFRVVGAVTGEATGLNVRLEFRGQFRIHRTDFDGLRGDMADDLIRIHVRITDFVGEGGVGHGVSPVGVGVIIHT